MNSKCQVQSKRRCKSHESCVCIVGFSVCGCQKKSVVYEGEELAVCVPCDALVSVSVEHTLLLFLLRFD